MIKVKADSSVTIGGKRSGGGLTWFKDCCAMPDRESARLPSWRPKSVLMLSRLSKDARPLEPPKSSVRLPTRLQL